MPSPTLHDTKPNNDTDLFDELWDANHDFRSVAATLRQVMEVVDKYSDLRELPQDIDRALALPDSQKIQTLDDLASFSDHAKTAVDELLNHLQPLASRLANLKRGYEFERSRFLREARLAQQRDEAAVIIQDTIVHVLQAAGHAEHQHEDASDAPATETSNPFEPSKSEVLVSGRLMYVGAKTNGSIWSQSETPPSFIGECRCVLSSDGSTCRIASFKPDIHGDWAKLLTDPQILDVDFERSDQKVGALTVVYQTQPALDGSRHAIHIA